MFFINFSNFVFLSKIKVIVNLFISCLLVELALALPPYRLNQMENAPTAEIEPFVIEHKLKSSTQHDVLKKNNRFETVQKIELHHETMKDIEEVEEKNKLSSLNVQHIKNKRKSAMKKESVKNPSPPTTVMIKLVDNEHRHSKTSHDEHRPEDNIRCIYDVIHDVVEDETTTMVANTEPLRDKNRDNTIKRNVEVEDEDIDDIDDMEKANSHGLGYYKETEWVYPQNYAYDGQNFEGYNNYNNNFNIDEHHVAYDQHGYAAGASLIPHHGHENFGYQIKPCHKLFGCKFTKWFW